MTFNFNLGCSCKPQGNNDKKACAMLMNPERQRTNPQKPLNTLKKQECLWGQVNIFKKGIGLSWRNHFSKLNQVEDVFLYSSLKTKQNEKASHLEDRDVMTIV